MPHFIGWQIDFFCHTLDSHYFLVDRGRINRNGRSEVVPPEFHGPELDDA